MQDLVTKLKYLLGHPEEVKRYQAVAADFICNKYNWDYVVDKTIEVYLGKAE